MHITKIHGQRGLIALFSHKEDIRDSLAVLNYKGAEIIGKVAVMPKYPCTFCRKNEATQLCDFVVGYSWTSAKDERGRMIGRYHETCDNAYLQRVCHNSLLV